VRYNSKSKRLEPFFSEISAEHLDFSRDGKWVAYVNFPDGTLWKSRVDGSERTQLTQSPLSVVLPRWSPDGKSIVVAGTLPNFLYKIYVVSAEGGKPQLVSEGQYNQVNPTWGPDGNSIVFGESQFAANPRIFLLNLHTGKTSAIPGSQGLYSPTMSPDGRFILAQDTPGNHKFLLFDSRTQQWAVLLDRENYGGGAAIGWPQWSADSKYVYGTVITSPTHSFARYRISIASRKVDEVTPFEVPGGTIGAWGPWIGLTPDGSPLTLRDLSSQEIYAIDVDLP